MKRALLAFAMLAALGACAMPARAADQSAADALTQYAQNLERTALTLDQRAQSLRNNARALAAARRVHRTVHAPAIPISELHVPPAPLPGPPRFSPSLDDWLQANLAAARLKKDPSQQAAILSATARTLRRAALSVSAPAAVPPHDIAPTLASILAQPAYHERESSTEAQVRKTWWQRFLEWLASLLDRLFTGLFGAASATPLFGRLISIATITLIALLVMLVAYRFARYVLARRRVAAATDAGEALPQPAAAAELYARALHAAAHGHYALAISLAFRAALMRLDGVGLVAYDAARTAGEYRRAVRRARAAAAPPFDELARTFTISTYAEVPAQESDWFAVAGAYRRFESLVYSHAADGRMNSTATG